MNKTFITVAIGGSLAAGGCASFERDEGLDGRVYVGAGALISELSPDTDAVDGVDVDESRSGGANVLVGHDLNHRFSVEGNYAQLGEATLSPDGQIDYSVAALSGVVYGLSDRDDRARREGFSVYGRAGIGRLDNDSDVPFEQINDFNLLLGLGAEYGFRNGLGMRVELVAHDEDVGYAQLALVYRIGDQERRRLPAPPVEAPDTLDAPDAPDAPVAVRPRSPSADAAPGQADITDPVEVAPAPSRDAPASRDADRDGVDDAADACEGTRPGQPVDETGCDLFDVSIDGVTFETGSATLTASSRQVLDSMARTLGQSPALRLGVEAHTDNAGTAENNLQLSRRRAVAVANYLVMRGVAGDRLVPRAFGESRPRVPNVDAEGRAENRRVEFRLEP